MLNILVNAYAVAPNWGSEPGMGWNWIVNIARFCNVYVITEGEWRNEIEKALLSLPQRNNIHFHYIPVSERIRRMCWNQGDWRFYYYYHQWQKRSLELARNIISGTHIDVIHQLNMIGFREPGLLWKIKEIPFVIGPVGGLELMPVNYLAGEDFRTKFIVYLKNLLNGWQRKHNTNFLKAIDRASAVCCATSKGNEFVRKNLRKDSIFLNETGCSLNSDQQLLEEPSGFDILWVGKFDFRKQLSVALKTLALVSDLKDLKFHILGTGDEREINHYRKLSEQLGLEGNVIWHGLVPNREVHFIMKKCKLLLFTSIMEGTPHVVLESIGNDLPVLCVDTCGQGDCVDEKCGRKVSLSDPETNAVDFAKIIRNLYNDRDLLLSLKHGCESRKSELSWERKAEEMFSIYSKALTVNNSDL